MDYSRQMNLLDPSFFAGKSVSIVGAGATGGFVAMQLAQHGFGDHGSCLKIFDGDVIEEHNLPNQVFFMDQVGKSKALSVKDLIKAKMGFDVDAYNMMVEPDSQKSLIASDIVFILTDSMKSRKDIFDHHLKNNPMVSLVVETRMGLKGGMVYAFDPCNADHVSKWESTLYTDEQATAATACGASQTAVTTASTIASFAAARFVQHAMQWMPTFDITKASKMWNELHVNLYSDSFYLIDYDQPEKAQLTTIFMEI